LLVSGRLQKEEQFYASFVEGGRTVKEFCQQVMIESVLLLKIQLSCENYNQ